MVLTIEQAEEKEALKIFRGWASDWKMRCKPTEIPYGDNDGSSIEGLAFEKIQHLSDLFVREFGQDKLESVESWAGERLAIESAAIALLRQRAWIQASIWAEMANEAVSEFEKAGPVEVSVTEKYKRLEIKYEQDVNYGEIHGLYDKTGTQLYHALHVICGPLLLFAYRKFSG